MDCVSTVLSIDIVELVQPTRRNKQSVGPCHQAVSVADATNLTAVHLHLWFYFPILRSIVWETQCGAKTECTSPPPPAPKAVPVSDFEFADNYTRVHTQTHREGKGNKSPLSTHLLLCLSLTHTHTSRKAVAERARAREKEREREGESEIPSTSQQIRPTYFHLKILLLWTYQCYMRQGATGQDAPRDAVW